MNEKEMTMEYRLAQWTTIIKERQMSGLNVKRYCEQAGVSETKYYYWLKKVRRVACDQLAKTQACEIKPMIIPQGFTEVKLLESAEQEPNEEAIPVQIQIEVSGIKITTNSTYPVESLVSMLRELRRP